MIGFIKRAWRGEIRLRYAFLLWITQILIRLIVIGVSIGLHDEYLSAQQHNYFLVFGYVIIFPFVVWTHVVFWRSCNIKISKNPPKRTNLNAVYLLIKFIIIMSAASTIIDYLQAITK